MTNRGVIVGDCDGQFGLRSEAEYEEAMLNYFRSG
jgi:hypothetical protein